jgi:putative SOS response-associated peptidase YedK
MSDGAPFAFSGVWDGWKDPDGGWLQSYSIITTTPNELTAAVHNRMPGILEPRDYNRWLEREDGERPPVDLLRPFTAEEMVGREAHKDVGNVRKQSSRIAE